MENRSVVGSSHRKVIYVTDLGVSLKKHLPMHFAQKTIAIIIIKTYLYTIMLA
jgi:hypothetical protein